MSNKELDTTHEAQAMPMPEVTDDGLALLAKQVEAMEAAHKLATVLTNTAMVPQQLRGKPDDGAAAILYGSELGLKPQQALQQVFVVHGQPAIYARTMVGLLKARGYTFETLESGPEAVTVRGTSPRGETEESRWTTERAKKAGYVPRRNANGEFVKGSNGKILGNPKYLSDPEAMLYAKAAAEVARKLAPDVLLGITYTKEELELEHPPVKATAQRLDRRGQAKPTLGQALGIEKKTEATTDIDNLLEAIRTASTLEDLNEATNAAKDFTEDGSQEFEQVKQAYFDRRDELTEEGTNDAT